MDLQYIEKVVGSLHEGIVSICNISKSLLDAELDPTTGMCCNNEQIRKHIEHAEQCLKKSETMIKEKLKYLDECMERLIKEKGNAEQQNKEKCKAMGEFDIEKKSAEESLNNSKAALEQAKKMVVLTQDELQRQRARQNTGTGVTIGGAVVAAIPIIGWIPGIIMMSVGASEIVKASNAIRDAENELKKQESQLNENSMKVSDYQSKIANIQNETEETVKLLNKLEKEIEDLKQHLQFTAELQETVRRAVNLLTLLSGRATVLEKQTQSFILWEPVIKAMKDVMKAAENVAENRLLYSQSLPGLINTLRENVGEILALCSSPNNSEHERYC
ncbi:uncharacterized protein LOC107655690 [Sinocyclocheilus anshuiensis]|uniref:uncharacterized protein LOC107655690 n=1 Tax=Sinocyclocheilus anshuiensis TaxID=1608454 RepID=UPI0007B81384|nr:PREDICTED: uncharacterized protein LOC107655690 [Sinocyclocheilus anshuiensis]